MTNFLQQTAAFLHETYGDTLDRVCIVTPNRRSALFLRKFLTAGMDRPAWSPAMYPVEEFMTMISGLREEDMVHLLPELYRIHRESEGKKAQSFEDFLTWGGQLLADFNDIDRNLADARSLFSYLDEAKAISLWNPEKTPLTPFQQNYLRFFHSLYHYYQSLTVTLLNRGTGYQGLIFRQATDKVIRGGFTPPWKAIVFAGFNALTQAEEQVMDHFHREGLAVFLWDADRFYTEPPFMEAGYYLRKWLKLWPAPVNFTAGNRFADSGKVIRITGIPGNIGQVKFCSDLISNGLVSADENTAIVIPDESLLMPLLNSVPAKVAALNITMGLPLHQTSLWGLLELVFRMHLHAMELLPENKENDRFYYTDVVRVLRHPVIGSMAGTTGESSYFPLDEVISRTMSGAAVFLRRNDIGIPGLFNAGLDFFDPLFAPWGSIPDVIGSLRRITAWPQNDLIGSETAFAFARMLHQVESVVLANETWFSVKAFCLFFAQMVRTSSLPFSGEPLQGIQIMGMLETRTLGFQNLILLSCNEGILPAGRQQNSFIPFDIRREYRLPTFHQQDAVYAYHFYRLLQHAGNVWLVYNTEPGDLGGGEPSRFIRQIRPGRRSAGTNLVITDTVIAPRNSMLTPYRPVIVEKTARVREVLQKKSSDGLSPSALNIYRLCPFKFYLSEIAGIREPEDPPDKIDHKMLGTAVHHALFSLFKPCIGKVLSPEELAIMVTKSEEAVQQAFAVKARETSVTGGRNLLMTRVADIMVKNFVRAEKKFTLRIQKQGISSTPLFLEQFFSRTLQLSMNGTGSEIRIKGIADRIDRTGGVMRIIDYKTGKVDRAKLAVTNPASLRNDRGADQAFQLLTYAWLLSANNNAVTAGIISLKTPGVGFLPVSYNPEAESAEAKKNTTAYHADGAHEPADIVVPISADSLASFESTLISLAEELLNPEIPFVQTENLENCAYCPYTGICGRYFNAV